jgi:2-polyprenyl-3-methyl-5-hydroxy-6-metoxy-1,4-benzoquinol methylase
MIDSKTLFCISCGNSNLELANDNSKLSCPNCKQTYPIENNIPILLLPANKDELPASEIHELQGTKFDYKAHYTQDAIDFDYFQVRDSGTEHSERRVREFILSEVPKSAGRILDVGCGKAWVAENCSAYAREVVSLDIAFANVRKALEKYPYNNHKGIVADSLQLPFHAHTFDFIIASEIIEHVVEPEKFVANLIQLLKPGGKLLVTTPYNEKLQYTLCIHCNRLTPRHAHIHSFNEKIMANFSANKKSRFTYKTFGNKALIHLRTHVFLKYLPFGLWKILDRLANFIYRAPATLFASWESNQ